MDGFLKRLIDLFINKSVIPDRTKMINDFISKIIGYMEGNNDSNE